MAATVLAIDCATEACSVALFDGAGDEDRAADALIAGSYQVVGRGHAEHLVPLIAALPDKGRAQRILVSLGPGSFTGIRIGLAAARALGIAWGAEVLGYPTLHLVAAQAQAEAPGPVTVCTTGGHGEWFVQNFAAPLAPEGPVQSLRPADAVAAARHPQLAGSAATALADLRGGSTVTGASLPDARLANLLPSAALLADLAPLYGRGPDARLPAR